MTPEEERSLFGTLARIDERTRCLGDMRKDIDELKLNQSKWKGWVMGVALVVSLVWNGLYEYIKAAFK